MPKIIIIDDDEQISRLLTDVCQMAGYEVSTCFKAADYFKEKQLADIAFLDLAMPDMDGIEVITQLKEIKSQVAIILMSGQDSSLIVTAEILAKEYGLNHIASFAKPMEIKEIIALLEDLKEKQNR